MIAAAAVGVVFTPVFMGFMGGLPLAARGRFILEWHRHRRPKWRAVNA